MPEEKMKMINYDLENMYAGTCWTNVTCMLWVSAVLFSFSWLVHKGKMEEYLEHFEVVT